MREDTSETTSVASPVVRGRYAESLFSPTKFSISWELVPGRGAHERTQEQTIQNAEMAARSGLVDALTITDNPGGSPAVSAAMFATEVLKLGIEPIVHLTCKDKNRNELEGMLWALERVGVRNVLAMTGDYPKTGYGDGPKPVFDLDAVTLLRLIGKLNDGAEVRTSKATSLLKPTQLFAGAVASPFKALEAEQMGQYLKLRKKLEARAQFVVSQIGFDARKFDELLRMMRLMGYGHVPVVGNVYVLSPASARLMNANGLPGCVVTDKLLAEIEREAKSADRGKSARLERAAKMYSFLKGMGFAGAHVSGNSMSCDDLEFVVGRGEELSKNWQELVREFDQPQTNGWYFFEQDKSTGLNTDVPREKEVPGRSSFGFGAMRLVHRMAFEKDGLLFDPLRSVAKSVDGTKWEPAIAKLEHGVKGLANNCLQCGDCALAELAFLCPQSECAKNQRNGPCGGSRDGWCEKYPHEKPCYWVRVYDRSKGHSEEGALSAIIPPVNWKLYRTSSWINFYLGRDHAAEHLGFPKTERTDGER